MAMTARFPILATVFNARAILVGERKLNLISRTVHTVLERVGRKHSLRVEWYSVVLNVFEIVPTRYQLFWLYRQTPKFFFKQHSP